MAKRGVVLSLVALSLFAPNVEVVRGVTPLTTIRVYPAPAAATALTRPLFAASPPGDNRRFFIVEQRIVPSTSGRIQILDLSTRALIGTFLTTTGQSTGNEEGLLGFAFHPNFSDVGDPNAGAFFIYVTQGGNNHVYRYTTTGQDPNSNVADPSTQQLVITFTHATNSNHNGGWIAFGPDGYLYINTGDGGSSCDPQGNGQNLTNITPPFNAYLGKMHRLNVNTDQNASPTVWGYTSPADNPFVGVAGLDEIWLYGLRNPWRASFDRGTGALYIGDVGQGAREEIDYVAPGASGINFGWDIREGRVCSSASGCTSSCVATGVGPIWDYSRTFGFSLTGGYVYRACRIPDLQGTYFCADYGSGRIFSFEYVGVDLATDPGGLVTQRQTELAPGGGMGITSIASFAEDNQGEIYIIDQNGGEIFKIIPAGLGDMDGNGSVNLSDVEPFVQALVDPAGYAAAFPALDGFIRANVNGDCAVNGEDVARFSLMVLGLAGPN
jgi:glucose/arabinose dehydrogenase